MDQSERTSLYREHVNILLHSGHAYRCFCSSERLNALAKQRNQLGLPTDYDRTCLAIPSQESEYRAAEGEAHVVRLRVPDQYPEFTDLVYGHVGKHKNRGPAFRHGEPAFEDPILLKTDGLPTYHLANVVDDHLMEITHVVRAAVCQEVQDFICQILTCHQGMDLINPEAPFYVRRLRLASPSLCTCWVAARRGSTEAQQTKIRSQHQNVRREALCLSGGIGQLRRVVGLVAFPKERFLYITTTHRQCRYLTCMSLGDLS